MHTMTAPESSSLGALTEAELTSQPACWLEAGRLLREVEHLLPRAGERVAVLGCGTSFFMAQAYAVLREARGHGETDAFPASEMPMGRAYDRVIALSRSGTTSEVLDVLGRLSGQVPIVGVTADPGAPLAQRVEVILLPFADEQSVVQTRFATTALLLLRAHLGDSVEALVGEAERALNKPLPEGGLQCEQFTFLGRGWSVGLASEAALKIRESAAAWAESYPAMEYRHGPIAITTGRSLVWMLGVAPPGLRSDVARVGGRFEESTLDPLAELVRVHRFAVELARSRGADADRPRNLTRSVILD